MRCIDGDNQIPRLETRLGCRRTLERLDNHHVPPLVALADIRADARIFARDEMLEIVHLLLRDVFRIRIEAAQHGVDTALHGFLDVDRIHIKHLRLFHDGIENLQILANLEMVILLLLRLRGE